MERQHDLEVSVTARPGLFLAAWVCHAVTTSVMPVGYEMRWDRDPPFDCDAATLGVCVGSRPLIVAASGFDLSGGEGRANTVGW